MYLDFKMAKQLTKEEIEKLKKLKALKEKQLCQSTEIKK
jgi:hypothetical protein